MAFPASARLRRAFDNPYLLLTIPPLCWGSNIVLGRYIAGHVPPIALSEVRWIGAFLILIPFTASHVRRDWPVIRRHLPIMLLLSLTGITLYNTLAYAALQETAALNGLLMQSVMPLMIGAWSLILYGDRLTRFQLAGIFCSLAGVVAIVTRGDPATILTLTVNRGDAIMIGAVAIYALYSALLKRRPAIHPLTLLTVTIGFGGVMLAPAFVWEISTGYVFQADGLTVATIVFVILFPSLLAYFAFNRGVAMIGPNRAGPFFHLIPVFGSAMAIAFLGEAPAWYHGVGYALVLAGVALAQRSSRKPPPTPAARP
jgi:drug/metabolite transporter (DMT)-like permease